MLLTFLVGVIFGLLLVFVPQVYLLQKLHVLYFSDKDKVRAPPKTKEEQAEEKIRQSTSLAAAWARHKDRVEAIPPSEGESCMWLNGVLHRIFVDGGRLPEFHRLLLDKIMAEAEAARQAFLGKFVTAVTLRSHRLGTTAPVVHRVLRLEDGQTGATGPLFLVDLRYSGTFSMLLELSTIAGLHIAVQLDFTEWMGRMLLQLPPTPGMPYKISFVEPPLLNVGVAALLDGKTALQLTTFLHHLLRNVITTRLVLPTERQFNALQVPGVMLGGDPPLPKNVLALETPPSPGLGHALAPIGQGKETRHCESCATPIHKTQTQLACSRCGLMVHRRCQPKCMIPCVATDLQRQLLVQRHYEHKAKWRRSAIEHHLGGRGPAPGIDGAHGGLVLQVTLVQARDCAAKDQNGRSDPYCLLSLGLQQHKSRCIEGTLDPTWNDTFDFAFTLGVPQILRLTMFDWDIVGSDDFMGAVFIDVSDLRINVEKMDTYTLRPRRADDPKAAVSGTVTLQMVLLDKEATDNTFAHRLGRRAIKTLSKGRRPSDVPPDEVVESNDQPELGGQAWLGVVGPLLNDLMEAELEHCAMACRLHGILQQAGTEGLSQGIGAMKSVMDTSAALLVDLVPCTKGDGPDTGRRVQKALDRLAGDTLWLDALADYVAKYPDISGRVSEGHVQWGGSVDVAGVLKTSYPALLEACSETQRTRLTQSGTQTPSSLDLCAPIRHLQDMQLRVSMLARGLGGDPVAAKTMQGLAEAIGGRLAGCQAGVDMGGVQGARYWAKYLQPQGCMDAGSGAARLLHAQNVMLLVENTATAGALLVFNTAVCVVTQEPPYKYLLQPVPLGTVTTVMERSRPAAGIQATECVMGLGSSEWVQTGRLQFGSQLLAQQLGTRLQALQELAMDLDTQHGATQDDPQLQ